MLLIHLLYDIGFCPRCAGDKFIMNNEVIKCVKCMKLSKPKYRSFK